MTRPVDATVRRDIPKPSEPDETVWASDSADNGALITAPALMQLVKHAGASA